MKKMTEMCIYKFPIIRIYHIDRKARLFICNTRNFNSSYNICIFGVSGLAVYHSWKYS